ncbi:MAG TPA: DUF4129 domain-containing protein [Pilimelia sp.]|nr:DUF4129 domain-containing protein [Pilimelia sp.]
MDVHALRRWWPLAVVAALLAAATVAAAHSAPQLDRVPRAEVTGQQPETAHRGEQRRDGEGTPEAQLVEEGGALLGWLATATRTACAGASVLALLLGLVVLGRDMLRRRRRPAAPGPPAAPDTALVVAALDAGLEDLSDDDGDPRRAVIACWLRLEEAAEAAGMPRHLDDTSTALVSRLLGAGGVVSAGVLADFAEVYRVARYATHTVDEGMRERARSALHRLRAELTAPAAAP